MKKFRIISFVMAAMLCVFMSCEREEPVSVEFKAPSYQLKVGETMDIIAELVIKNTDAKPVFTSSDAAVAVVADDGKLNALAPGEAVIKAVVEGKEATCSVTVTEIQAGKITITAPESLPADETWGTVKAAVEPEGYDTDNLEWTFTPSAEGLEFETEKVKATEYKVRFKTFVEGGKLTVKVSDKNSDMVQTADIAVTEKVVPATRIALDMPDELTGGEGHWAVVTATVTPEEYDTEHLVWDFEPSSADLGFKYEKVSATEYKVAFEKYVEGGFVKITVSDELSEVFNEGRIKVGLVDFDITIVPAEATVLTRGLQQDKSVRLLATYKRIDNDKDYVPSVTAWKSSDETIATVDSEGNVTAVAEVVEKYGLENGLKVTITHTADHIEQPIEIVVVRAQPEKIVFTALPSVDGVEGKIMHGESFRLETKVLPEKATQAVGMIKTNPDGGYGGVLSDGVFYAAEVGTYSVMAYVETSELGGLDGINQVQTTVSIEVLPVPVETFTIVGESELVLETGDEIFLVTEVLPANASFKTVTWSSSPEGIVSVNQEGKLEALAAGVATVTGTLKEGKTVQYVVTVKEPVKDVNVGDYYYSDGTYSSELDDSKKVIGIVFSTQNPTLQDSGLDGSCVNGLVISLEEASAAWQSSAANVGDWLSTNIGYNDLKNLDKTCGYSNTKALKEYNEANPDSKVLIVEHAPAVTLPESTSGWFVPSYAEILLLVQAYETVSANLAAAGGTALEATRPNWDIGNGGSADTYRYWSSTESPSSSSWACGTQFFDGAGLTNLTKTRSYYRVRYVFAF